MKPFLHLSFLANIYFACLTVAEAGDYVWICNFRGFAHDQPNQCSHPEQGGQWKPSQRSGGSKATENPPDRNNTAFRSALEALAKKKRTAESKTGEQTTELSPKKAGETSTVAREAIIRSPLKKREEQDIKVTESNNGPSKAPQATPKTVDPNRITDIDLLLNTSR
jgi:hypothetical protein